MPLLARLLRPPVKEAAPGQCRLVVVEESTEERGCGALLQLDAAARGRVQPKNAAELIHVDCLERESGEDVDVFEEAGAELSAGPALLLVDDWAAMCGARGSWRATLSALDGVVASGRFRAVCVVALRETVPAPALAALHRVARCSARAIAPSADAGRVEERDAAAALAQTRDVTCGVYAVVSEAAGGRARREVVVLEAGRPDAASGLSWAPRVRLVPWADSQSGRRAQEHAVGAANDVLGAATVSATEADEAAAAAKGEQSQRERRQHVAVGAEPGPELADTLTQKQREARDRALHPMQVGAQGGSRPLFYADPGDSDFDEDLDADLDV